MCRPQEIFSTGTRGHAAFLSRSLSAPMEVAHFILTSKARSIPARVMSLKCAVWIYRASSVDPGERRIQRTCVYPVSWLPANRWPLLDTQCWCPVGRPIPKHDTNDWSSPWDSSFFLWLGKTKEKIYRLGDDFFKSSINIHPGITGWTKNILDTRFSFTYYPIHKEIK